MAQGDGEEVIWLASLVSGAREVHDLIIQTSGGVLGEDTAKLSAACARPFQSAGGKFLYETDLERAGALFHGIICGHVFADGCKRTAVVLSAAILVGVGWLPAYPDPATIKQMELVALRAASPPSPSVDEVIADFRRIFGPDTRPGNARS